MNKVVEIISQIINIEVNELNKQLDTEKLWDSMNSLEIIIALEEEFEITFTQEEIMKMTTVNKIIETIKNKKEN